MMASPGRRRGSVQHEDLRELRVEMGAGIGEDLVGG